MFTLGGRARRAKANPDRSFPQLSTFHSPQAAENRLSPGLNHAPFFFSFPSGVQSESSQTQSIPEEPGSSGRIWLQRARAGGGGVTWWPDLPFVRGPRLQPVPPTPPHTRTGSFPPAAGESLSASIGDGSDLPRTQQEMAEKSGSLPQFHPPGLFCVSFTHQPQRGLFQLRHVH